MTEARPRQGGDHGRQTKRSRLSDRDWTLSMRISPRPHSRDPHPLRSLLVHRLEDDDKAIYRVPSSGQASALCEPCAAWFKVDGLPEEIHCPRCGQVYEIEFAVYRVVEDGGEDE